MAQNDVYVAKLFQEEYDQVILNQFFYKQITADGDVGGALGLFQAMDNTILTEWEACVVSQIAITNLEIFVIETPSIYVDGVPTNNIGTRTVADALVCPSWIAFEYTSNRDGAGSRRSHKRFAGLAEADVDNNSLAAAFLAITEVTNLKNAMAATINDGETVNTKYEPVQVKANWVVNFAPTVNFSILSWQVPRLSSQVSRKP